jgi:hypothetical protein
MERGSLGCPAHQCFTYAFLRMKTLLVVAGCFSLAAVLPAQAQTPASTPSSAKPTPKIAEQRAATYKGPKVVKDTKALGTKMIRESKPDRTVEPSVRKPIK